MTIRILLCSLAAACSGSASRDRPPAPQAAGDAGATAAAPIDASTAPVNSAVPEAEFWKQGDAACPDGGKLVGAGSRPGWSRTGA